MLIKFFFLNYFPTAHIPACFGQFGKFMQSQPLNEEHCQSVMCTEPSNFPFFLNNLHVLSYYLLIDKLGEKKRVSEDPNYT